MDLLNVNKAKIDAALLELKFIIEKTQNVEFILKSRRDSIEQNILKLLKSYEEELIGKLNDSFYGKLDKVHVLMNVLHGQKFDLLNFASCLSQTNNDPSLFSIIHQKLCEVEITQAMSLESFQTLEVVFEDNFEVARNIGYIKTSILSPRDMTFYIVTKSLSSEIHPNDVVYIRVLSDKAYDPFILSSLSCRILSPNSTELIVLEGDDLKDTTYEFKFIAKMPGKHHLRILLYGVDIKDSPAFFKVSVNLAKRFHTFEPTQINGDPKSYTFSSNSERNDGIITPEVPHPNLASVNEFYVKLDNLANVPGSVNADRTVKFDQTPVKLDKTTTKSDFEKSMNKDKSQILDTLSRDEFLRFNTASEIDESQGYCTANLPVNGSLDSFSNKVSFTLPSNELSSPMKGIHSESVKNNSLFLSEPSNIDGRTTFGEKVFWSDKEGWHMTGSRVDASLLWQSSNEAQFYFPIGVATTPEDQVVVCDTGNHRVVILDSSGNCISSFGKEGYREGEFKRPSAVVVYSDGKVVIKDDNWIQFFSSDGEFLGSCGSKMFSRPYGLAIDGQGRLVTVDVGESSFLYLFNSFGKELSRKPFQPLMPVLPTNSKCRFIDANEHQVIAVDLGRNCVYRTNLKGELLEIFGSKGKNVGQFRDPAGVSLDSKGNMFIADSKNHRVQVFDCNGGYLTTVKFSKQIHRPSDIYLTKTGKLLVLNYTDHSLCAYSLKCY